MRERERAEGEAMLFPDAEALQREIEDVDAPLTKVDPSYSSKATNDYALVQANG